MTPNRVVMLPGKAELEVVPRSSFVDTERARIQRSRAQEISEFFGRFGHITDAILIQTRRRGEVVFFGETKTTQVIRRCAQGVMLEPIGDAENVSIDQEFSHLRLLGGR